MQDFSTTKDDKVDNVYHVKESDLPLCCPTPTMQLWDSHPRIYLSIRDVGYAICPYCSAEYHLEKNK